MEQSPTNQLAGITGRLSLLRRVARLMLIGETAAWMLAVWVAGGVAVAMADYFLRMPGWLRGGWLGLGAAVAIWLLLTRVIPAWRFRPSLTEFALRVERSEDGRRAGLEGVLASAVDIAERGTAGTGSFSGSPVMSAGVVARAAERAAGLRMRTVLKPARTLAAVAAAALMGVMVTGIFAARPQMAAIGAFRILAPWSGAEWPRRTDIEVAVTESVHPLGTAFALRAALLRSDQPADQTRLEARYRLIEPSGAAGPVRRVTLTCQQRPIEVSTRTALGEPTVASGTLFERLIEPAALEPSDADQERDNPRPSEVEFWFTSQDDQTAPVRVLLVRPPSVVAATAAVAPPAYLGGDGRRLDLGPGNDERATIEGVLEGSRIELVITLNKPVPEPAGEIGSPPRRDWIAASLGAQFAALVADGIDSPDRPTAMDARFSGRTWTLAWTARDSVRLPVRPMDEHGIWTDTESVFRIDTLTDRPPEATVTVPGEDTEALAEATVRFTAEARDDVALASLEAEWRLARAPAGSEGASPEPMGEVTVLSAVAADPGEASRSLSTGGDLVLSTLGAQPGDEVWLTALAKDRFELDGRTHEPVRSSVRRVRIIAREQLIEQIWAELGATRRAAIRLAEQQTALREPAMQQRTSAARDQGAITEAAQRQDRAVERLQQRAAENSLRDEDLAAIMEGARRALDKAGEASTDATASLKESSAARSAGDQARADQAAQQAGQQQDQAQAALEDLADLLDRGEDAWSVRRGVERLLEDQKSLRESAARLGEQTLGKSPEELSAAQRQEAGKLSEEQSQLAQRAAEAINRLRQNAQSMSQEDPATAAALDQAAQQAERARLQEQMEQAARDIQQNRQQSASQQQDRAISTMEQMLDQMQQATRGRDEILQRQLASLVESIEGLIRRQEREIAALEAARPTGAFEGLDQAMIALRTSTLAVLEEARAAGREAREVVGPIEAAATAQADAITALRSTPHRPDDADAAERLSLERLKQARARAEEARQAAEDRNIRRQRAELKKAYRELLDKQLDLRTRTRDVAAMEEGRRQRAAARELAAPQDRARQDAADLLAANAEIGRSEAFQFAHERLDAAMSAAGAKLAEGEATPAVLSRQAEAIRVLQGVLEALSDLDRNTDEFREQNGQDENAGGGQGGQRGQQPLIPDGAQLKLLRAMQAEALALTREAAETGDAEAAASASMLQQGLHLRAVEVLRKLQEEQRGGRPAIPGGDAPQPVDPPGGGEP